MPSTDSQFLPESDTFSQTILDRQEALIFMFRSIDKLARGEVDSVDVPDFAQNTLKGAFMLMKPHA